MFPHFFNKVFGANPQHVLMEPIKNHFWSARAAQVKDSMNIEKVSVPVLLPHEVLHAVWHAGEQQVKGSIVTHKYVWHMLLFFFCRGYRKEFLNTLCCAFKVSVWKPWQFTKSMLGTSTPSYIEQFWNHCRTCEEWADHPVLQRGGDLGRTFSRLNVLKNFPNLILGAFISKAFQFGMLWGTRVTKVRTPTNHIALWWCRVLSQFWIFSLELVQSDGFWWWHSTFSWENIFDFVHQFSMPPQKILACSASHNSY